MTGKKAGWLLAAGVLILVLAAVFIPTEAESLPKAKESAESWAKTEEIERIDREEWDEPQEKEWELLPVEKEEEAAEDEPERFALEPKGTLFVNENFDASTDTFGFSQASLKDGTLRLVEDMQAQGTCVKEFNHTILGQSMVELSFRWQVDFSGKKGKSGIEFRDLYGRLIFALGCRYEESTKKWELCSSAAGAANSLAYALEPQWTVLPCAADAAYGVFLRADFVSGEVDAVIYDETNVVIAKISDVPIEASGLAQMAACNYGQAANAPVQVIDDFKLYAANDAGSFPLEGKNVVAFGDSILDGHLYKEAGFVEFLAKTEGMHLEYNYANNGARMMIGNVVNPVDGMGGTILDCQVNVAALENRNPDYIIFDGGANDAYSSILGKLGTVTETDLKTFAWAFRGTVRAMHKAWPNAKIIYVAIHKLSVRDTTTQERMYQLELAICRDMGVEVADLYHKGWDTTNIELNQKYGFDLLGEGQIPVAEKNSSGTHPNFLAIEEFYVPVVTDAIKRAGSVTISAQEMEEAATLDTDDLPYAEPQPQGITVSFGTKEYQIAAGKTVELEAKVSPGNAADKKLNWTITANQKYASLTATANKCEVSTKKSGAGKTVTVLAEAADGSGSGEEVKIQIMKHAVTKVGIRTKKKTLKAGTKLVVKASVKTSGAKANKKLEWTVSDPEYAALKPDADGRQCIVTAKNAGIGKTVVLTVRSTDGTDKSAEIRLTIQ